MKQGQYFNIPETRNDWRLLWKEADVLTEDMTPDWLTENGDAVSDWRYVMHTSWAYIRADDQDAYFEELDSLDGCEYSGSGNWYALAIDGDDGDGCVHHVYIKRGRVS